MTGPDRDSSTSENAVVAVVVTFHPESVTCVPLLRELRRQCAHVVVVDNGSAPGEIGGEDGLRSWCVQTGAVLIELGRNAGIAAAQNIGIAEARRRGARWVLLSDDDSEPSPGMVSTLLRGFSEGAADRPVAAVGPLVGEDRPGSDQLVYVSRRWGPRRATPVELERRWLPTAFLIASGCLIDLDALDVVGPMNEAFFIDHVDLEWGLRAHRAGFATIVATAATMSHALGDEVVHLPGRRQPVHMHGPVRNYYLARNTLALVRSGLLPAAWRLGYLFWLAKYSGFNSLLADRRGERFCALVDGVRDGLAGRGGPRRVR